MSESSPDEAPSRSNHGREDDLGGSSNRTFFKRRGEECANKSWCDEGKPLIPGLPNDLAIRCIARLPRGMFPYLRLVSACWRDLVNSEMFRQLRRRMGFLQGWIYVLVESSTGALFRAFDPEANKWYSIAPVPGCVTSENWQGFACVALESYLILMGGAKRSASSQGEVCGDVFIYDAFLNSWRRGPSLITPRSWFAAAVVGGLVYVAGGQGRSCFLDSAEVLDLSNNRWRQIPPMRCVRSSCRGMALNNNFWVVAGEVVINNYGDQPQRASAEVFNPKAQEWTLVPEMWLDSHKVPGPNTIYRGSLLVVHQSRLMLYNAECNEWEHLGYISSGRLYNRSSFRFGFALEALEDRVYVIGGRMESWQNRNRSSIQLVSSAEVCELSGPSSSKKFTRWDSVADMKDGSGTILASATLLL